MYSPHPGAHAHGHTHSQYPARAVLMRSGLDMLTQVRNTVTVIMEICKYKK